jgi:hypothetical protein
MLAASWLLLAPTAPAWGGDGGWWPFSSGAAERQQERPYLEPMSRPSANTGVSRSELPPVDSRSRAVERSDLAPVMANDGSGLPLELWAGLDLPAVEKLMASLDLPPRSPAMGKLWRRLLTADVPPPQGASQRQFIAVRIEALYRTGLFAEAQQALASLGDSDDAVLAAESARLEIALGRGDRGCERTRAVVARRSELPPALRNEVVELAGYCAAATGNAAAAGLAAELGREAGVDDQALLQTLDAIAARRRPDLVNQKRIGPTRFRLIALAETPPPAAVLERADVTLLAVLARDSGIDPRLRLAAAEAAAAQDLITADELAAAYRDQRFDEAAIADPAAQRTDPLMLRAVLLQAAERAQTPERRARLIKALADESRRAGTYLPTLVICSRLISGMPRVPEIAWLAETAIEASLAAGRPDEAQSWVRFASAAGPSQGGSLEHWLALADISSAQPIGPRGIGLDAVEDLVQRRRMNPTVLQRLATVLDALDYQVPMGLWHAAASVPQPNDGYLPETGALSDLLQASKSKQYARTVLLTLRALGPHGAEGAHIIALGDAIRALRRAGLEREARRLGFEALFTSWPRSATN